LEESEALEAVYQYAKIFDQKITNETAPVISQLCQFDPFFISCIIESKHPEKDLSKPEKISQTIQYELTHRKAGLARTWADYIDKSLNRINDTYARKLLLFLTKHSNQQWTHYELKDKLKIDLEPKELLGKLLSLAQTDLIEEGTSDIHFRGIKDGTLYLVLRERFHEEIKSFEADDLQEDFRKQIAELRSQKKEVQGKLSNLAGKIAEDLLATELRSRKRVLLSDFFRFPLQAKEFGWPQGKEKWNFLEVRTRVTQERADGKVQEIDIFALAKKTETGKSSSINGLAGKQGGTVIRQILIIEVKKWKNRVGKTEVEDFYEKLETLRTAELRGNSPPFAASRQQQKQNPESKRDQQQEEDLILGGFVALGGFTKDAQAYCEAKGLATADRLLFLDRFLEKD
jgi:hypothetical protein